MNSGTLLSFCRERETPHLPRGHARYGARGYAATALDDAPVTALDGAPTTALAGATSAPGSARLSREKRSAALARLPVAHAAPLKLGVELRKG
jgi:hypothetical protein